jgi:RimJ/RimL family protein N-acetyltransferase
LPRVRKIAAVLRDHYRSMRFGDFLMFLRDSLFTDQSILIYGRVLDDTWQTETTGPHIRKGSLDDLRAAAVGLDPVPWEVTCNAYDRVTDFFVYRPNGRVGHISWLYYHDDPNRLLRLRTGECEIKFCLTLPEFRGCGVYPAALKTIQRDLRQRGFQRCFICVDRDNLPSIRGIEKAGFRRVGDVRLRKLFGMQISRRRSTVRLLRLEGHRS